MRRKDARPASKVVREDTRDDPTLKSAQKSRVGHPSCDSTADCLPRDCRSVGHRHRAMTGQTSPKRGVGCLSKLRQRDALPVGPQSGSEGRHVISVRRHLTKNRPGLTQKVARDPVNTLLVKRRGGSKDPTAHKGRGPKNPAAQEVIGIAAPLASTRLLRQLSVFEQGLQRGE